MADTLPQYPEVETRKKLSKKQRAEVILRQNGCCAGCGIKPRHGWELDHDKALWKGETNQADLSTWVAYGSRKDCGCHQAKTSMEAGERAKMKRVRSDAEKHATRLRMKGTMTPAAYRRALIEEKLAKGRAAIPTRPFPAQQKLLDAPPSRKGDTWQTSYAGRPVQRIKSRGFSRTLRKRMNGKVEERT